MHGLYAWWTRPGSSWYDYVCMVDQAAAGITIRHMRIMPAEKLAEFGTFSGKFHACLVCG